MRSGLRVHFYINGFVFQNTVKVQDPSALSSALSPKSLYLMRVRSWLSLFCFPAMCTMARRPVYDFPVAPQIPLTWA